MKTRFASFVVFLLLLSTKSLAVEIDTTHNLVVYYPEFSRIDLVCEQMPTTAHKDIVFCCEAAFTGQLLQNFSHKNIADNHICNGEMKRGYKCAANTGGFVWGKNGWKFVEKKEFPAKADGWEMGFCQLLIIKNGADGPVSPIYKKIKSSKTIYRALCEKDGRLCIVESKQTMTYAFFVECLKAYKVKHALYLDMGSGWNYAWYRDEKGKVTEKFPRSKQSEYYKYRTNWITFYK
ncbi:MAG: hypothetical protein ACI4AH_08145 [Muribaculaceae bacterium]